MDIGISVAKTEQHVQEWDRLVQATCPVTGRPQFSTESTADGPRRVPLMVVQGGRAPRQFH